MVDYDGPATFRGQLQRGRGIAVRRAAGEPQAGDAVYECVIHDPRWDRQTEARAAYLAGLVRRLGLPLGPIEGRLVAFDDDDPDEIWLLLDVLAELALDGHEDAAGVLRRYIAEGRHWGAAISALAYAEPQGRAGTWVDLVVDCLGHRSDEEFRELVEHGDDGWMRSLAERSPRIRDFYDRTGWPSEQERVSNAAFRDWLRTINEVPSERLLQRVASRDGTGRWALVELGRRQDAIVLDLVEDPSLRNPAGWLPGASAALEHLGTDAVSRARGWVSGSPPLAELGIKVLAAHGDHTDIPALMAALTRAFDNADLWCAAERPAEGLGRLRVAEAAPLLIAAWETTVHSYGRKAFLTALHDCAPHAAEAAEFVKAVEAIKAIAEEGLDDCESGVREVVRGMATPRQHQASSPLAAPENPTAG